jgi:hypothetical protein
MGATDYHIQKTDAGYKHTALLMFGVFSCWKARWLRLWAIRP